MLAVDVEADDPAVPYPLGTAEQLAQVVAEAHRLVALFFGAMGITEHAKVKVRTV